MVNKDDDKLATC